MSLNFNIMASQNKKNKARNSYCANSFKVDLGSHLKKIFFFDARQRKQAKKFNNSIE